MRNAVLVVVVIALLGMSGFILWTKYGGAISTDTLVLNNVSASAVTVRVGSGALSTIAPGGQFEVPFESQATLKVWIGESGTVDEMEGAAWQISSLSGPIDVGVEGDSVTLEGPGLDASRLTP